MDIPTVPTSDTLILSSPVKKIPGIGIKTGEVLSSLGIFSALDLLQHYPYRYEDYSRLKKIRELRADESITIKAVVTSIQSRRSAKNKRITITEAILTDETGNISAVWFNQPYLSNTLHKGHPYIFSGHTVFRGKIQMQTPVFESLNGNQLNVGRIVPIYSLPEGLFPKRHRGIINDLLKNISNGYDYLPKELLQRLNLPSLKEAWQNIHFPQNNEALEKARQRLAFNELLAFQLQILMRANELKKTGAPVIAFRQEKIKEFVDTLPFKLTFSQKKAAWEIIQDLNKPHPMNRLLQGDVGSGKTVVAGLAAYACALENFQTALLAPTEILAQQHFTTLQKLSGAHSLRVSVLTGSLSTKEKSEIYKRISSGKVDLIIGTHALLNENVKFKNLGLIIVDEQHRFGVRQRAILREQKNGKVSPHLLSMTATPIPRTLALTLYGDLSLSSITEMPPGKAPVETQIITPENRKSAYALMRKEILRGHQCFVICPLLEESDVLGVKSATEERNRLSSEEFKEFSIGLIHGRMSGQEKEIVMQKFRDGQYHILVSTSVVEVGIDVPNATVVLIEGAERFGLAQMHQFRGRVGRGGHASHCLLLPTLSDYPERLNSLVESNDGFKLSEIDLKLRGMGKISGVEQSGFWDLKIADPADLEAIKMARAEAEKLLQSDPLLENLPELKKTLSTSEQVAHLE